MHNYARIPKMLLKNMKNEVWLVTHATPLDMSYQVSITVFVNDQFGCQFMFDGLS